MISQIESNHLFSKLPYDVRQRFYAEASNSDISGQEWFFHEIPDILKGDAEGVRVLLNGGEVTVNGVTHVIPKHEFSRIEAGVNGGEYTPDNVLLESEAINGARGGADMDVVEQLTAETSLSSTAETIASRTSEVAEGAEFVDAAAATAEGLDVLDVVSGGLGVITPIAVGLKAGQHIYDETEGDEDDKMIAGTVTTIGAGLMTLGAVAASPALGFAIPILGLMMSLANDD